MRWAAMYLAIRNRLDRCYICGTIRCESDECVEQRLEVEGW